MRALEERAGTTPLSRSSMGFRLAGSVVAGLVKVANVALYRVG